MQVMSVMVDMENYKEFNALVKQLDYAKILSKNDVPIEKGIFNKNEKPSDFAGIWKDNNITLKDIRATAWQRKK